VVFKSAVTGPDSNRV